MPRPGKLVSLNVDNEHLSSKTARCSDSLQGRCAFESVVSVCVRARPHSIMMVQKSEAGGQECSYETKWCRLLGLEDGTRPC
eukprot:3566783-Rhodomonas_salina.2